MWNVPECSRKLLFYLKRRTANPLRSDIIIKQSQKSTKIWDKNLKHKFLLARFGRVLLLVKVFLWFASFLFPVCLRSLVGEKFLISHIHIFNDHETHNTQHIKSMAFHSVIRRSSLDGVLNAFFDVHRRMFVIYQERTKTG